MNKRHDLSRITIDIPEKDHKQFKAMAAYMGKSMRELVVESIQKYIKTKNTLLSKENTRNNHE